MLFEVYLYYYYYLVDVPAVIFFYTYTSYTILFHLFINFAYPSLCMLAKPHLFTQSPLPFPFIYHFFLYYNIPIYFPIFLPDPCVRVCVVFYVLVPPFG